jgi:phosphatidylglycerol:prolipoprotein diacylglycerol transferase
MFTHNLDPVLIALGPVEIRYYGIVYALGFFLSYIILRHFSKKGKLNLSYDDIDLLLIYLIIGLLVGARLFEAIFWEPAYYFANPIRILEIWKGGMAFHGGFVGLLVAGWIFVSKHNKKNPKRKVKLMELADIICIPGMLMLAIGRIANFINAELPGKIVDPEKVSWCVKFPRFDGCRHPSQIYESITHFIAFGILLTLNRWKWKAGFIFWNFVFFYGIGRVISDIWRDDPIIMLGLNMGQLQSLIMVIVAIIFMGIYHKDDVKKIFHL